MGDFVFVLLVLGGLGVFFYRQSQEKKAQNTAKLQPAVSCATRVEKEKTAETVECKEEAAEVVEAPAEEQAEEQAEAPNAEMYDALTWRVLQRVMEQPGILQTDIYGLFPRENRKHLQATLLQLDKENVLRREKEGNTYRLFPV